MPARLAWRLADRGRKAFGPGVLAIAFLFATSSCRPQWAELGLEEIPYPPVDRMESKVGARTTELVSELEAQLAGRDRYALTSAFGALGRHYHAHELHEAALASYRNASRLEPAEASWRYLLGVASQAVGDLEAADAAYVEVIDRDPGHSLARVRLAEVRLARSDPAGAEAILVELLAVRSDLALGHFFRGQALQQLDRPREALSAFERALEAQPDADALYYEMALAARAADQPERAEELMALRGEREIVIEDPLLAELEALNVGAVAHLRRGARAQIAGDWDEATRHYRLAVEADPSNAEARQSLAGALARRGEHVEAIEHYRAALAGDAGALPRANLAGLLVAEGRYDEALKFADQALALDPEGEQPRRIRAAALGGAGRFDEAIEVYRALLDGGEEAPELLLGLARALAGSGERDQALETVERAIETGPDLVEAHFVRGNLLGDARRYREAADSYGRVLERDPRYLPAWLGQVTALALGGELDRAAERVDAGLAALPNEPNLTQAKLEIERRLAGGG